MTSATTPVPIPTPAAGHYRIDPVRSTVSFTTRHMFGLGGVTGTFAIREAELVVGDPVTSTTLSAVIDAASFESGKAKRDADVASPKLLDTATFPDITVTGTGLSQRDGRWVANGTVFAHGVSAPLELVLDSIQDDQAGELVLRATTRIDRYAHGVTAAKGMAGRWLDVTLDAFATRS